MTRSIGTKLIDRSLVAQWHHVEPVNIDLDLDDALEVLLGIDEDDQDDDQGLEDA